MRLMDLMIRRLGTHSRQLTDAADEIVRASRSAAMDTVTQSLVKPMSLSEARGYVRSRSRVVVKRRMAQVLSRRELRLSATQKDSLLSSSLERVITRTLDHVEYGRPATSFVYRRAA